MSSPTEPTPKPARKPTSKPASAPTAEIPVAAAPAPSGALTTDERAELERLRAEVAATRAAAPAGATAAPKAAPPAPRPLGRRDRAAARRRAAGTAVGAGHLSTRSTLLDTDKYLAMVPPLAERPGRAGGDLAADHRRRLRAAQGQGADHPDPRRHRRAAARRGRDRAPARGARRPSPSRSRTPIYGFTEDQVSNLVASDTFQDAWVAANREAHAGLVAALTGETTATGVSRRPTARCRSTSRRSSRRSSRCSSSGACPSPTGSPPSTPSSSCSQSDDLGQGPDGDAAARPPAAWCCPCSRSSRSSPGVALAPSRRRALVIGASMVVGSLVLLLLGVQVLRALYLDDLEQALLVPQVATVLFDTVTTPLRLGCARRRCSSSSSPSAPGSPARRARPRPCGRCRAGCPG